jgi:hypothetical protein
LRVLPFPFLPAGCSTPPRAGSLSVHDAARTAGPTLRVQHTKACIIPGRGPPTHHGHYADAGPSLNDQKGCLQRAVERVEQQLGGEAVPVVTLPWVLEQLRGPAVGQAGGEGEGCCYGWGGAQGFSTGSWAGICADRIPQSQENFATHQHRPALRATLPRRDQSSAVSHTSTTAVMARGRRGNSELTAPWSPVVAGCSMKALYLWRSGRQRMVVQGLSCGSSSGGLERHEGCHTRCAHNLQAAELAQTA